MASENADFDALASQAHEAMAISSKKSTLLEQLADQVTASPTEQSYTDEELDRKFPNWGEDRLQRYVISMENCIKKLLLPDDGEKAATDRAMALAQLKRLKTLKSKAWLATVRIHSVTYDDMAVILACTEGTEDCAARAYLFSHASCVQANKNQEEATRPEQAAEDCQIVDPPAGAPAQHNQAPMEKRVAHPSADDDSDFQPVHNQ